MKKSAEVAGPIAAASVEETVVTRLRECCDRSAERESTGRRGDAQPGVREVGLVCVTRSRSFGIFPPRTGARSIHAADHTAEKCYTFAGHLVKAIT
jgi:hypothetical protein